MLQIIYRASFLVKTKKKIFNKFLKICGEQKEIISTVFLRHTKDI